MKTSTSERIGIARESLGCDGGRIIQPIQGDVLDQSEAGDANDLRVDVTIVCPFYNEGQILGAAIETMLDHLEEHLEGSWELVVVNDGSTDDSAAVAEKISIEHPKLRVLGYRFNRGRGHALRAGINQALGDIIVTTECDLSWGEDIVERVVKAMRDNADADIVVASPHLPGGGYKNVPAKRVFLSKFGNYVIRALMVDTASMNTGMTRGYRRDSIQILPLTEDGKEFHLEVILKAKALGYRIAEIPALLEWKQYKHDGEEVKRKSSSKVNKLMVSHSLFSLFAHPIRYIWPLGAVSALVSICFLLAGVVRVSMGLVSVYMLIVALAFGIIALILFIFGVLSQQGNLLQVELWKINQEVLRLRGKSDNGSSNEVS